MKNGYLASANVPHELADEIRELCELALRGYAERKLAEVTVIRGSELLDTVVITRGTCVNSRERKPLAAVCESLLSGIILGAGIKSTTDGASALTRVRLLVNGIVK
jgi:hypothetical protein